MNHLVSSEIPGQVDATQKEQLCHMLAFKTRIRIKEHRHLDAVKGGLVGAKVILAEI